MVRFRHPHTLADQHVRLSQLGDNLLRAWAASSTSTRPPSSKAILKGGPLPWGRIKIMLAPYDAQPKLALDFGVRSDMSDAPLTASGCP